MTQLLSHVRARIPRWWPLALALGLFAMMFGVVIFLALRRTHGHFTYALDDAYIHMALAKNLARHGVWGATRFEFSSSSSSPLWTLVLALAFAVFGVHDLTALVLTTLISVGLLVFAEVALRRLGLRPLGRLLALTWIVLATPMAPIVFGGMEHPLQLLIDLAIVCLSVEMLSRNDWSWQRQGAAALALAALTCSVRYEGAVLVVVIAIAFALRGRWRFSAALLAAGAAPVIVFGLVSMAHGGYFLPNSVLVKAATQTNVGLLLSSPSVFAAEFARKWPTAYPVYMFLAASIALAVVQWAKRRPLWSPASVFALIAIAVSAIHLVVGDVGWFFRYEDYMVMLLGVALVLQVFDLIVAPRPRSVLGFVGIGIAALTCVAAIGVAAHRGDVALRSTPWAMKNIYDQQYQLAHFLAANPEYGTVAIGDLGAISFYNDNLHVIDLEGLALNGVPREALGRTRIHAGLMRDLALTRKASVAIVFTDYFDQPKEWRQVATWTIERDLVTYQPTVGFYAIPPTDSSALERAIRLYSEASLPKDVHVQYP